MKPHFLLLILMAVAGWIATIPAATRPAMAHAGHDDDAPAPAGVVQPRAQAESDVLELVAIASGRTLTVFLDRIGTNAPVEGAAIEVSANGAAGVSAEAQPNGTYRLDADWVAMAGKYDLIFTITAGDLSDLLTATLVIPAGPTPTTQMTGVSGLQQAFAARKPLVIPMLTFLLGIFGVLVYQQRGRRRAAAGGTAIATVLLLSGVALAAEVGTFEPPRRQSDGSVFVPKPSQRLLAVRTVVATQARAARMVQVIGQVVPDPNASGRVQSSQPGIVEPGEDGLAFVGKRVRKGDVLAEIAPAIGRVERGAVGVTVAEIDQQMRLAEQKLARLSALTGTVPGKEIDEARAELEGARRRRTAVAPTLAQRELVRAPVSGVVSVAGVLAGQFVDSRDVLFEIVDPSHLWVEALAFDPDLAEQMRGASAVTSTGVVLAVRLVGRGLAQRQGAIPLVFAIENPPPGLGIGAPVTVIAEIAGQREGIPIPRGALVRLPNGGAAVWDHVSAERFVPRPVRVEPLDGARVLVLAGLLAGQRIVTTGADLLSQVR